MELTMRPQALIGVILIVIGALVVSLGITYKSKDEVLRVGDIKATVEEKRPVPTWAGGVAIVAGIVLVLSGMKRRA